MEKHCEGEEGLGKGATEREDVRQTEIQKRWQPFTIDVETILVQGVGAQLGETTSQPAQLPVQVLAVQPGAPRVRAVCADDVHSGGCPILPGPGEGG